MSFRVKLPISTSYYEKEVEPKQTLERKPKNNDQPRKFVNYSREPSLRDSSLREPSLRDSSRRDVNQSSKGEMGPRGEMGLRAEMGLRGEMGPVGPVGAKGNSILLLNPNVSLGDEFTNLGTFVCHARIVSCYIVSNNPANYRFVDATNGNVLLEFKTERKGLHVYKINPEQFKTEIVQVEGLSDEDTTVSTVQIIFAPENNF